MNYEDAISYIEQLNTRGIALGLERITALLELLGNPQDTLRVIHVAGTNGKGSVCAFIDSALRQAGMRVGRYISPALYAYLERFQINGAYMSEEEFAQILARVREACDNMEEKGLELPTVFEVETAVAFLYFQAAKCDYVLLEVGMGGRLDSTNVIMRPVLS
ncbi:MAG: bifunctional folylpolyglutamate synthase/dihydrofolate synthase, partial [Peptococcaceae bacterium]|nr:bifunctional folylpolyglutamate synthase/dihydrofolate synthase [Peptococcaceae bacterium]